jgi:hypothetical protein
VIPVIASIIASSRAAISRPVYPGIVLMMFHVLNCLTHRGKIFFK